MFRGDLNLESENKLQAKGVRFLGGDAFYIFTSEPVVENNVVFNNFRVKKFCSRNRKMMLNCGIQITNISKNCSAVLRNGMKLILNNCENIRDKFSHELFEGDNKKIETLIMQANFKKMSLEKIKDIAKKSFHVEFIELKDEKGLIAFQRNTVVILDQNLETRKTLITVGRLMKVSNVEVRKFGYHGNIIGFKVDFGSSLGGINLKRYLGFFDSLLI